MGKWSYSDVKWSPEYRAHEEAVGSLTVPEAQAEWEKIGSPQIGEYGLNLWYGISGDGWACIDNSSDETPDKKPLLMFCDREDFTAWQRSGRVEIFEHWFHRACLLAHRLGIERRTVPEAAVNQG